jgi:hypothetical protein
VDFLKAISSQQGNNGQNNKNKHQKLSNNQNNANNIGNASSTPMEVENQTKNEKPKRKIDLGNEKNSFLFRDSYF